MFNYITETKHPGEGEVAYTRCSGRSTRNRRGRTTTATPAAALQQGSRVPLVATAALTTRQHRQQLSTRGVFSHQLPEGAELPPSLLVAEPPPGLERRRGEGETELSPPFPVAELSPPLLHGVVSGGTCRGVEFLGDVEVDEVAKLRAAAGEAACERRRREGGGKGGGWRRDSGRHQRQQWGGSVRAAPSSSPSSPPDPAVIPLISSPLRWCRRPSRPRRITPRPASSSFSSTWRQPFYGGRRASLSWPGLLLGFAGAELYRQGASPVVVFRSALVGPRRDHLQVRAIQAEHGLQALFAFKPEASSGALRSLP
uniref:Uncharacterized protein n=1 Tax=Oryza glumipatula TaxID=40148 RepID=A0A0D9Y8Y9_9ORYZ